MEFYADPASYDDSDFVRKKKTHLLESNVIFMSAKYELVMIRKVESRTGFLLRMPLLRAFISGVIF